jgi:hypothetical protein
VGVLCHASANLFSRPEGIAPNLSFGRSLTFHLAEAGEDALADTPVVLVHGPRQ